jgi:NAD(P)-dependent dehydrogenase (short-subunit alcohol dehydrogenase family)
MGKILEDKVALVTGASSGIGAATVRLLAQDGAAVLMMGRREEPLARVRDEILKQTPGARLEIFAGDACEEGAVKAALAQAHGMMGRLDILVPTVGAGGNIKPLLMMDEAEFQHVFRRNVISAFLMVRYGAPLLPRGGSIVCISTAVVMQPFWGLSAYGASKAALERFVRAAALELGGAGIRINAVRPGMTRSADTEAMYDNPDLVARFENEILLGRTGEPEDIARVVRFMAGPESGWVTGQSISADGGQDQGKIPDLLDDIYGKDVMEQVRAGKAPAAAAQA